MTAFEGVREHPDGATVHMARVFDGLWSPICEPPRAWEWPLARRAQQVTCPACIAAMRQPAAAVRVVAAPTEETP